MTEREKALSDLNILQKNAHDDGQYVFGFGRADAEIVLIGEAPGKNEVIQGKPFVGSAGHILDEMLSKSNLSRDIIYVTNAIKFRLSKPGKKPGTLANRPAKESEIEDFAEWLYKELSIIKPKLIVTLGNVPLKSFGIVCEKFGCKNSRKAQIIGEVHGKALKVNVWGDEVTHIALYHPASMIYNRLLREVYTKDMEGVQRWIQENL